jgi:hypothetical protein
MAATNQRCMTSAGICASLASSTPQLPFIERTAAFSSLFHFLDIIYIEADLLRTQTDLAHLEPSSNKEEHNGRLRRHKVYPASSSNG